MLLMMRMRLFSVGLSPSATSSAQPGIGSKGSLAGMKTIWPMAGGDDMELPVP